MRIVRCPSCRRDVAWADGPWRPFCSERCKLLDLAAWADERFRIPGDPVPTEAEADVTTGHVAVAEDTAAPRRRS